MTEKKEPKLYKITVEVLGVKTTKTGKTPLSALKKFKMTWEQLKGSGILFAEYDGKKWEKNMNAPTLRRIFTNDIAKQIWANNITLILQ